MESLDPTTTAPTAESYTLFGLSGKRSPVGPFAETVEIFGIHKYGQVFMYPCLVK